MIISRLNIKNEITIFIIIFIIFFGKRVVKGEETKNYIVKLQGGCGNQMFLYSFGKALENKVKRQVLFDKTWYEREHKYTTTTKYCLNIFEIDIHFATRKQIENSKTIVLEKEEYVYDPELFNNKPGSIFIGYFQNEKYFENIKNQIKNSFVFPIIPQTDKFNQKWIQRISNCENPVFIHLRRADYLKYKWNLSINYYKNSVKYIISNVKNPTFFVFGIECNDFIKKEFNIDVPFEVIGDHNSNNNEDWKDIILMQYCKHAIIANSTFSWWATWLGKANNGIVIAPTPFIHEHDEIICNHWIKISR